MIKETSGPEQLIYLFSKLPGLGTRSARRIVIHLLQDKDLRLKGLIDATGGSAINEKDIDKNNLYHPVKDINNHINFRKK